MQTQRWEEKKLMIMLWEERATMTLGGKSNHDTGKKLHSQKKEKQILWTIGGGRGEQNIPNQQLSVPAKDANTKVGRENIYKTVVGGESKHDTGREHRTKWNINMNNWRWSWRIFQEINVPARDANAKMGREGEERANMTVEKKIVHSQKKEKHSYEQLEMVVVENRSFLTKS